MELLISTNIENIRKVANRNVDITTSVESAKILLKTKKYDKVIADIDITGLDTNTEVTSLKNYLKSTKTTNIKIYKQKVISIYSAKGGIGKTTLAKKIAESLSESLKVLIIDINFADGGSDLSYMLELPVIPHIGMYLKNRSKKGFIDNIVKYKDNIYVMQAPPNIKLIEGITPKDIIDIINYARGEFDIILIDLPNEQNMLIRTVLDQSSQIIVLSMGYAGELKRIKEILNGLNYTIIFKQPVQGYKELADILNKPYIKINDFNNVSYIIKQIL